MGAEQREAKHEEVDPAVDHFAFGDIVVADQARFACRVPWPVGGQQFAHPGFCRVFGFCRHLPWGLANGLWGDRQHFAGGVGTADEAVFHEGHAGEVVDFVVLRAAVVGQVFFGRCEWRVAAAEVDRLGRVVVIFGHDFGCWSVGKRLEFFGLQGNLGIYWVLPAQALLDVGAAGFECFVVEVVNLSLEVDEEQVMVAVESGVMSWKKLDLLGEAVGGHRV